MGGGKKKTRRSKGGGKKKNWWDKSGGNSDSAWVGKYRILVKAWSDRVKSEYFVVDLKQQMIVMKHPEVVWSDKYFNSTAVLHKGTLSVLNICVENTKMIFSDTCTSSTLDLTKTPPIWSNWTPVPKMNIERRLPYLAVLDDKIFVFGGVHFYDDDSEDDYGEVYQIGGGASSDDNNNNNKWEKITIPSGGPKVTPISDPNNNRLIAYFDSLYAYNPPNIEKWDLLHEQKLSIQDKYFLSACDVMADQVVGDNLVLYFNSYDQIFMAHNIVTNKWLNVDPKFDYKIYFGSLSRLVHLGNDILCLADSYHQYPDGKSTVLNFLRFSVKLVEEKDRLQLTPLSFHSIVMDDDIRCFADTFIPF